MRLPKRKERNIIEGRGDNSPNDLNYQGGVTEVNVEEKKNKLLKGTCLIYHDDEEKETAFIPFLIIASLMKNFIIYLGKITSIIT